MSVRSSCDLRKAPLSPVGIRSGRLIVAKRWSLTLGVDVSAEQVIICLIDLKLARLNSTPGHHDSILDVAGYAAILNEIINNNGGAYGA